MVHSIFDIFSALTLQASTINLRIFVHYHGKFDVDSNDGEPWLAANLQLKAYALKSWFAVSGIVSIQESFKFLTVMIGSMH